MNIHRFSTFKNELMFLIKENEISYERFADLFILPKNNRFDFNKYDQYSHTHYYNFDKN